MSANNCAPAVEPDEEKAKAILTKKLKQIINDPNFDPLNYGGAYD